MKLSKLLLAVVGATVLLGALVSSASARNLSASTQSFRASWTRMDFTGPFGTTECEVTLAGTLHARTMPKVVGSLMGYITAATLRTPCRRGAATILRETLPWHVQYDSFVGALPSISSIRTRVVGASFQINEGFICLARTSAARPATGTFNLGGGGAVTSVVVGGRIPTTCGLEGTLGGTSTANDALNVTLI